MAVSRSLLSCSLLTAVVGLVASEGSGLVQDDLAEDIITTGLLPAGYDLDGAAHSGDGIAWYVTHARLSLPEGNESSSHDPQSIAWESGAGAHGNASSGNTEPGGGMDVRDNGAGWLRYERIINYAYKGSWNEAKRFCWNNVLSTEWMEEQPMRMHQFAISSSTQLSALRKLTEKYKPEYAQNRRYFIGLMHKNGKWSWENTHHNPWSGQSATLDTSIVQWAQQQPHRNGLCTAIYYPSIKIYKIPCDATSDAYIACERCK